MKTTIKKIRTSLSKKESANRTLRRKVILIFVGAFFGLYVIGLVNPVTGAQLQYPYYELFCGRKPVIASSFMVRTYHTPDMRGYEARSRADNIKLYCTESEAEAAGYPRSSSLPIDKNDL